MIIIHKPLLRCRDMLKKSLYGLLYGQRESLVYISSKLKPAIMLQSMGNAIDIYICKKQQKFHFQPIMNINRLCRSRLFVISNMPEYLHEILFIFKQQLKVSHRLFLYFLEYMKQSQPIISRLLSEMCNIMLNLCSITQSSTKLSEENFKRQY